MLSNAADPPRALEHYVDELRGMARSRLGPPLRAQFDPSDLVQQTLMVACAKLNQFRGATHAELRGWLRTILVRTLARASRRMDRSSPERAVSLDRSFRDSSAGPMAWLADNDSTPSHRADRHEQRLRLAAAMAGLPDDQRTAIELHHFQSLPLVEVAARMGRTVPAVAGLIFRGGRALRDVLS